jgi:putative spermidine/putrescine transport system permease protein
VKRPDSRYRAAAGWRVAEGALYGVFVVVLCYLVVPSVIVVPMSFSASRFLQFPPPELSLRWYRAYLGTREWTEATWNSIQVATATAVLATGLGTLAALGLRRRFWGRSMVYGLLISPLVIPVIVLSVALYLYFAPLQKLGLPLIGRRIGLILAHTVLAIPFVVVSVSASLKVLDEAMERAAQSLGASPGVAFRRVTFPLIRPGVVAGGLFAFVTSFDEAVAAIFLGGPAARTLPLKMWEGVRLEVDPTLAAVSSLLVGVTIALVAAIEVLRRRSARLAGQ